MQSHKPSIKQWAKDDRPREKLLSKNPQTLTDTELLAILIRTGTPDSSAIQLAQDVYRLGNNNLLDLARLSVTDLMKIRGIGMAKAVSLAAALELGRRRQEAEALPRYRVSNPLETANWLRAKLKDYKHEVFGVLYLNSASKILHFEIVGQGGLTNTAVDARLIFKTALSLGAVSFIVCHNHPSGSLQPSQADKLLTQHIRTGAQYLDIRLLDHIIVSQEGFFSFADNALL